MTFEIIGLVLGAVASLFAIIGGIVATIKWARKEPSKDNEIPQTRMRKRGLISNNLPSLESIGNLVGKGRKRKQIEILEAIKQHRVVVLEAIGGIVNCPHLLYQCKC